MNRLCIRSFVLLTALSTLSETPVSLAQEPAVDVRLDYAVEHPVLEGLIRDTLAVNPRIARSLANYRASIQNIPQVTALPDPMVTFTKFVRSPETRVGPQTSSLMLSQRFPWFGKLDLRGKIAVREASALYERYRALEREVVGSVKDVFYELAYLDRTLEITQQEQLLLEHFERLASGRYAAGEGLQYGVIRMQAEITRVLSRLEVLGTQRESAVGRLNTLRSRPTTDPIPTVRLSDLRPSALPSLDPELLFSLGQARKPELQAVLDEIEKHELSMELAGKDYWPDITLSAGMVNVDGREDSAGLALPPPDNGKNAFSFSVGINIPLHRDKYRARELAASERRVGSRDQYQAILDDMRFEIRDQILRLESLERQSDLYERVLVPQAESALASAETAYETGLVGATELLDSERILLDIRLAQTRFTADYLKALARLELALGTRFPDF